MVVQRRSLDIGGRPPVVVDDRHAVARIKQLLGFDKVGAVRVHHDEQRARLGGDERVVAEIKASLYSGRAASLLSSGFATLSSMSMTICAFLPRLRAMQQMPAAAPTTSMSACAWPMTKIWPASEMSSPRRWPSRGI